MYLNINLCVIRHAESLRNACCSHLKKSEIDKQNIHPNSRLTKQGVLDCFRLRHALQKEHHYMIPFDGIFHTNYIRTLHTATFLFQPSHRCRRILRESYPEIFNTAIMNWQNVVPFYKDIFMKRNKELKTDINIEAFINNIPSGSCNVALVCHNHTLKAVFSTDTKYPNLYHDYKSLTLNNKTVPNKTSHQTSNTKDTDVSESIELAQKKIRKNTSQ